MKLRHLRLCSSVAVFAALPLAATAAQPAPAPAPRPAPGQPAKPGAKEDGAAEVVVTGTRAEVVASTDRISFSVANDLQVQTGSVADALRVVPGVDVDLQGNVSLRGDPGVTILIDGRPSAMLRGDSRGDVLLSMPAGQLERVEVISNPSAALSPEGSGGVINLVTKQVKKDTRSATVRVTIGPEGRGGINLSGAQSGNGLTLTGDVGYRRITGEASGIQQRARLDPGSGTFVTSRQDTELDTVNAARTARVGIEYDPDKKNRLSTDFNYREFSSDVDRGDRFVSQNAASSYNRDSDIALSQRGIGARASWRHTLGKEHDFVADLEVEKGRLRRGVDAVTDFDAGPLSFERIRNAGERAEYNLKLDYKRPLGDESSLNLGYHVNIGQSEFDSAGIRGGSLETLLRVPGLTNSFDYDQTVHALFGTYRFTEGTLEQITDAVEFERDYLRLYPTLHLGYTLSKTEQLRASYSRRIQRPSPQDLNPYTFYIDPQNIRRGNPFLLPEITDSFEAGWQHRKAGTFYALTAFYRRSRGGVTDILSDLGGGVFLTTRANLATAERVGVELIANGKLSILNLGYRRKVSDTLSLLVTGQNVLDTARQVTVFETPALRDRFVQTGTGRVILFGLSYTLGGQSGKRRPEPGFDFQGGGDPPPQ
jgi:outer membrane receptor protein involved in Fe transport